MKLHKIIETFAVILFIGFVGLMLVGTFPIEALDSMRAILLLIGFGCGILLIGLAIFEEKIEFNNGICPVCGNELELRDTDSQGGRLWMCKDHKCDYHCWISYGIVDHT